jgi:NTP pyrophosphatase (non-canonical NTP hydrolase)
MSDDTIESILPLILDFRHERDWAQFHTPKNLATALSIEGGELLENFLWRDGEKSEDILSDPERMERIRDEVADVLIYLLFLSNDLGIDLPEAVREKVVKNREKYPVSDYRGRF